MRKIRRLTLLAFFTGLHIIVGLIQYNTCCSIPNTGLLASFSTFRGPLEVIDLVLFLYILVLFYESCKLRQNENVPVILLLVGLTALGYILKFFFFQGIITTGFACQIAKSLLDIMAIVFAIYLLFQGLKIGIGFGEHKLLQVSAIILLTLAPAFLPKSHLIYYLTYPLVFIIFLVFP